MVFVRCFLETSYEEDFADFVSGGDREKEDVFSERLKWLSKLTYRHLN